MMPPARSAETDRAPLRPPDAPIAGVHRVANEDQVLGTADAVNAGRPQPS